MLLKTGEKSGFFVGHTEDICTGYLAGHNAARNSVGMYLLKLPTSIAIGDFITYANQLLKEKDADRLKLTFAGSIYFNRMKELGFYTIDRKEVEERVRKAGLEGVFNKKIIK